MTKAGPRAAGPPFCYQQSFGTSRAGKKRM
jgi:hypothetical protein